MMRQEGSIEGVMQAKLQLGSGAARGNKGKGKKENYEATSARNNVTATSNNKEGKYPSCRHCDRRNHTYFKCWRKPDMKCRKCQKLGHAKIICKEKGSQQQTEAQIADQEQEQLFVATSYTSKSSSESWLIDSGCTNHMTSDEKLFRELDRSLKSRVRIENGEYLPATGKGTIAIESFTGTKLISEVLFVLELDQSLLDLDSYSKMDSNYFLKIRHV